MNIISSISRWVWAVCERRVADGGKGWAGATEAARKKEECRSNEPLSGLVLGECAALCGPHSSANL